MCNTPIRYLSLMRFSGMEVRHLSSSPYGQLDAEALGHNELDIKVRLKCIPSTVVDG